MKKRCNSFIVSSSIPPFRTKLSQSPLNDAKTMEMLNRSFVVPPQISESATQTHSNDVETMEISHRLHIASE